MNNLEKAINALENKGVTIYTPKIKGCEDPIFYYNYPPDLIAKKGKYVLQTCGEARIFSIKNNAYTENIYDICTEYKNDNELMKAAAKIEGSGKDFWGMNPWFEIVDKDGEPPEELIDDNCFYSYTEAIRFLKNYDR